MFTKEDYNSNDGMITLIWGPPLWHFLHTMSFNYPVNPSEEQKQHYRDFILSLHNVLPCGACRRNLKANFEKLPLYIDDMENRETFSRYMYNLHEIINEMLQKKSNLSYEDVRDRYENFRARCVVGKKKKSTKTSHKGCLRPFKGKRSKCIVKIIPDNPHKKCDTIQVHKDCLHTKPKKRRRSRKRV